MLLINIRSSLNFLNKLLNSTIATYKVLILRNDKMIILQDFHLFIHDFLFKSFKFILNIINSLIQILQFFLQFKFSVLSFVWKETLLRHPIVR